MLEIASPSTTEVLKAVATVLENREQPMRVEIVATARNITAFAHPLTDEPPVTTS